MAIIINSSKTLEKLLDSLSSEVIDAVHFFKIYKNLVQSIGDFGDVFTQSPTFWHYTLRALRETTIYTLCRLYDRHPKGLSLPSLLNIINDNLNYFSEENFRKRLTGNPFVDSLAESTRVPDQLELARDIDCVCISNPLVKKLMLSRNNIYAHKGAKSTLSNFPILQDENLKDTDILELIDLGYHIYNKYIHLFKATIWSRMLIGEDDFMSLLKFANAGQQQRKKNIEREIAMLTIEYPPAGA